MTTPAMARMLFHPATVAARGAISGSLADSTGFITLFMVTDDFEEGLFEVASLIPLNQFRDLAHRFEFALIEDGHAVAHRLDFAQLVRGEEDGFAFTL